MSPPVELVMTTASPAHAPSASHLADPDHHPSFTRGVFLGEIREALVFPFPEPSTEEKESLAAILDAFRSWAADTLDSAQIDHDGRFPDAVRQGMAELGLMGLNIPERYGGFGASAMILIASSGRSARTMPRSPSTSGRTRASGSRGSSSSGPRRRSSSGSPGARAASASAPSASPRQAPAPMRRRCAPPPSPARMGRTTS